MSDDSKNHMSIEDAIRLKRGMNAEQIKAMQDMNGERWKQLHGELAYIQKSWYLFPNLFWIVGLSAGIGCALYFHHHLYVLVGGLIVTCYCLGQLTYRAGHQCGYLDGFESGHRNGVNTALGITPEEDKELHDLAIEVKIQERKND